MNLTTKFYWINFVLLTLNSFSTGIVKILQLEFEMELFRNAGISDNFTVAFGVLQLLGAFCLVVPKVRRVGGGIMVATFVFATGVLLKVGMIPFAVFSLLFIAMAAWPLIKPLSKGASLNSKNNLQTSAKGI